MEQLKEMLGGLHQSGTALIKRGTAMGPLIPLLVIVPFLLGAAWLFRDTAVFRGVAVFSLVLFFIVFVIIVSYVFQYARFAKNEPDRLQSEQFRVQMKQIELQRVIAKDGTYNPDALEPPTENPVADPHAPDSYGQDNTTEKT